MSYGGRGGPCQAYNNKCVTSNAQQEIGAMPETSTLLKVFINAAYVKKKCTLYPVQNTTL
jgi:hypothetical protein